MKLSPSFKRQLPLTAIGLIFLLPSLGVTLILVLQQTVFMLIAGPQMVGFSLAHGYPLLLDIYFLSGIVGGILLLFFIKNLIIKQKNSLLLIIEIILFIIIVIVQRIPESSWINGMLNLGLIDHELQCDIYSLAAADGDIDLLENLDMSYCESIIGSPIYYAAIGGQAETIKYLLGKGYRFDDKYINSGLQLYFTPLINAAQGGHFEAVKVLLEAGADPNISDSEGHNAIDNAKKYGNYENRTRGINFEILEFEPVTISEDPLDENYDKIVKLLEEYMKYNSGTNF